MAPRSPRNVFTCLLLVFAAILIPQHLGARQAAAPTPHTPSPKPQAPSPKPQASSPKPPAPGLGQFAGGPPPCNADATATPAAPQDREYKPNAPERTSFIEPGVTGTKLVLTGTVSGLTCGPIKHAVVEFWQADPSGVYDKTGFRFRGRQATDDNGRYRLETLVPGSSGATARRIYVRVLVPGKPAFTTQLFFPDDPRKTNDAAYRPELLMKIAEGRGGKIAAFDIVLNI